VAALLETRRHEIAGRLDDRRGHLLDRLARLPAEQHRLVYAHYFEDETVESLAARIAKGREAVHKAFQRIRRALHECMGRRRKRPGDARSRPGSSGRPRRGWPRPRWRWQRQDGSSRPGRRSPRLRRSSAGSPRRPTAVGSGNATLLFGSGAEVRLVGPCILEPQSEKRAYLLLGQAVVKASAPSAKGFTVETRTSRLVDIGTEFVAATAADGQTRVDVSVGTVDVSLEGVAEAHRLRAGDALCVEPGDRQVLTRIERGDGTAAFRFPTIEPPVDRDYAAADAPPSTDGPPAEAGWVRLARVESDDFFRVARPLSRPAQQACSVFSAGGQIGRYRYLLWEVEPTLGMGTRETNHTFYGEFDIDAEP
jgi:hypothetical protein